MTNVGYGLLDDNRKYRNVSHIDYNNFFLNFINQQI
jgi:hypothetical protein